MAGEFGRIRYKKLLEVVNSILLAGFVATLKCFIEYHTIALSGDVVCSFSTSRLLGW